MFIPFSKFWYWLMIHILNFSLFLFLSASLACCSYERYCFLHNNNTGNHENPGNKYIVNAPHRQDNDLTTLLLKCVICFHPSLPWR